MGTEESPFTVWIKQRRRTLDLTQEDLADCVGCSTTTIQKIELGERRPSKQVAQRLAECLRIPSTEHTDFVGFARGARGDYKPPLHSVAHSATIPPPLTPTPNNLPTPLTLLIGREEALEAAHSYLQRPDVRLVTLTGVPGVGKTRLSLDVAAQLLSDFDGGVYFVELASIVEPGLVPSTIATTIGCKDLVGGSHLDWLKQFIRDRRILLVLDNFEQILDAAPTVVDLLSDCPRLRVMVTSREALHVTGEQQLPVSPLPTPDLSHLPNWRALSKYPSVELFIQRAAAADPSFRLRGDNFREVAAICARLEGLPLAIELAAARVKFFSPKALLSRLENRLNTLTAGARERAKGLPQRQQTLRGAIEWSYDLLSEEEKKLFRRLAVFAGGRTIEAVEAVCNAHRDLGIDIVDGLISLVEKSLLRREEGTGGEPRLVMLETIHEYAREKLWESGEAEALRREHALYFMRVAEEAEPHLRGKDQLEWLEKLEDEFDNIRAALRWAKERGERRGSGDTDNSGADAEAVDIGLRTGTAIWRFWFMRSHLSEGREELIRLLALQQTAKEMAEKGEVAAVETGGRDAPEGSRKYRADALNRAGYLAFLQGDLTSARLLLEECRALYRELDDKSGAAASLLLLGSLVYQQGDYATARSQFEESLALYGELEDKRGVSIVRVGLALVIFLQGEYASAGSLLKASLAFFRESGDIQNIAVTLGNMGLVAHEQGDYTSARSLQEEALALRRELGNKIGALGSLAGLGAVNVTTGQTERGTRLLAAVEALQEELDTVLEREDRISYERAIGIAREQLGEEAFQQAWQEGRAMSMEQAIECALKTSKSNTDIALADAAGKSDRNEQQ